MEAERVGGGSPLFRPKENPRTAKRRCRGIFRRHRNPICRKRSWKKILEEEPGPEEANRGILATWWTTLGDPELSSLIERAVAGNLDLRKTLSQVSEARARRGGAEAALFPTLDATGAATWSRSEKLQSGAATTDELYRAGFDAGWELDIFGGVRRSVEAAGADLAASEEELRDVLVSLLAEVALNYIEVRTYQTRLTVAEDNLRTQEETYRLAFWRQEAGLSDELAYQQALYNLENTRSQIPDLRASAAAVMAGLAKLRNRQYHRMPLSRPIGDELFELRHIGSLNTRVLYFFMPGRKIVTVHGIRNKGWSIPAGIRKTAIARMKDWLARTG